MMSLTAIINLNEEVAAQAAVENKQPYVPGNPQVFITKKSLNIPNLGGYVPEGWEETEQTWFVDKTGVGRQGEPALTIKQFRNAIVEYAKTNPEHGYGIIEEGEMQLYISAFARV